MGEFQWTHRKVGITIATIVAALYVLPNLGNGWKVVRWIADAFPTAYAAKDEASTVRSDFNTYIAQRQEELKLEQQRNELQEQYNKKLLEVQQQQQMSFQWPNPAAPRSEGIREWDASAQQWWCCPLLPEDREACWARDLWRTC